MHLDPKHLSLYHLLQNRLFRIPEYQRAYAWETKQRDDLFNDIHEVKRSNQNHFMATIVSLARKKCRIVTDEYQVVDVVDGQQRLTTLVILLKAIESSLTIENSPVIGRAKIDISELLVKGDEHSLLLLQTNHDSSNVFTDYIRNGHIFDGELKTAADRNLLNAIHECIKFVANWQADGNTLLDLVALLKNRLSVIYHEMNDEASVYRVFEVLNSRGLDVKWIDKVKSQLMALIFNNAEDTARNDALREMHAIWQGIYRTLGLRGNLGDEALRFAGTMIASYRPNRLLSQEDAAGVLVEAAGQTLGDIVRVARQIQLVVDAVGKLDNNNRLRAVTGIVHARFVAAAILLRKLDRNEEENLLAQWERITFRIFGLSGADSRYKVGEYVRLGYDASRTTTSENEIMIGLKKLGEGYSINEVLKNMDWSYSYEGWTEELRYILFRFDEHLARQAGEVISPLQWNKIWEMEPSKSIEHISPQSDGEIYVHCLGNLTMLPPGVNSSLKDKPPQEKANTYMACGIKGTVAVANTINAEGGWSEAAATSRTSLIEDFIRGEWAD